MNRYFLILILITGSLIACKHNRLDVDVSGINIKTEINPFYKNLFTADTADMESLATSFYKQYGHYWKIYNYGVIQTGDPSLKDFPSFLAKFLNNKGVRELADSCMSEFSETKEIEDKLQKAFKHLKYYYPEKGVPEVLFHISGFNQSVVIDSGFISVGIDNYLGKNSKYYKSLMTPMYLREKMNKERIPMDIVLAYGLSEFTFRPKKACLVSNMLYQGKIRYFLKAMMPDISDAEVMGYTNEQLEWCKNNEEMIWQFFVKNKYLFSTDYKTIMKYINDGPFTAGMPKDSPGLVAVWLGMQIVEDYVIENNCSLNSLMEENDYNKILRKSAYQP